MAEFDLIGVDAVTGKMGKTSTSDTLNINLASLKDVSLTSPQTGDILVRTENGWSSSSPEPSVSVQPKTQYFTATGAGVVGGNTYVDLLHTPIDPEAVVVTVIGGSRQVYTTGFEIISDGSSLKRLSWSGLSLEEVLFEDVVFAVDYSYGVVLASKAQFAKTDTFTGFLVPATDAQAALNLVDSSLKYKTLFEEHFLFDTNVSPSDVLPALQVLETDGTFSFDVAFDKYGVIKADTTNTAGHTVALNKTLVYNYMGSFQGLRVSTSLKHNAFNTDMREIYFGWERYYNLEDYYDRVAIVGETVSTDYKYYLVVENGNGQTKTELFSFSASPTWGELSIEFTDTAANFSAHGQTASVLKSSSNFPTDAAGFPVKNLELRFVSPTGVSAGNPVLVDYIKAEVER